MHLQDLSLRDGPISEALWGQAYATLKAKEPTIMSEYERCICPDMRNSRPAERMEGVVRRIYGGRETEQNDAMVQELEKLASLILLYRMREAIYINKQQSDIFERHTDFENAVIKLYYRILEFQARLISHLWKGPMTRLARNTVRADDWKGLPDQINEKEC